MLRVLVRQVLVISVVAIAIATHGLIGQSRQAVFVAPTA
jgi:hypothetical protein